MKHFRKTIALFLVVVMLTTTMGSTVLAGTENQGFSDQAETTVDSWIFVVLRIVMVPAVMPER